MGFHILTEQSLKNGRNQTMTIENLLNFINDFEAQFGRPPSCLKISEDGFKELATCVDGGHHRWSASDHYVGDKALKKLKVFGVEVYTYATETAE